MQVVIQSGKTQGHIINKYQFKVLGTAAAEVAPSFSENETSSSDDFVPFTPQTARNDVVEANDEHAQMERSSETHSEEAPVSTAASSKDEMIESLLKKVDEVTSNFIKVQMKLEDTYETHTLQLEEVRKEAFEQGVQEGLTQAKAENESSEKSGLEQFANSVQTLEQSASHFEQSLTNIQGDLLNAALDIAQEVINMEVHDNGNDIALKLSEGLIEELKTASNITLKVNPSNHGVLSEKLGTLTHIKIVSDSAVHAGGVVVFSDAGNIDAQLYKRYERVKEAALSGE